MKINIKSYDRFEVVYIDEFVAVVYKPSGLLSVPAPNVRGRTAQSSLEEYMRKTGTYSASHHPFAVHRLDRDTSGVMMFALTKIMQDKIMNNWQTMVTERLYNALCENPDKSKEWAKHFKTGDSGTINSPLAYNAYHIAYVPRQKGKEKLVSAVTHYKVLKAGSKFTLFELNLETGRKNQIRAHLASLGYPITGDENYRAKTDFLKQLGLHACVLSFIHPVSKKEMNFEVSRPEKWDSFY